MSKVLCPVDFSATSLNAIEFAANIAAKLNTNLELVNIFTEDDFNKVVESRSVNSTFKEQLGMARGRLELLAKEINAEYKSQGLVNCDCEVMLGELDDILYSLSKSGEYRMIVMGTTGIGKRPWMGSNTSKMIQKSSIPILSVPGNCSYKHLDKMVYASDFMEEDKVLLQDVISFAIPYNARIYVLHLVQKAEKLESAELKIFFEELRSFVEYDKISFDAKPISETISQSLLSYMKETESKLLVVYSKDRGFFEKIVHKSVAIELSVISNRPIMVLK